MRADVSILEEGLLQEIPVRTSSSRVAPRSLSARPLQCGDRHQDHREQAGRY